MSGKLTTNLGNQSQTKNLVSENVNTKTIQDITGSVGLSGQVLSSTALGINWVVSGKNVPTQTIGSLNAPVVSTGINSTVYVTGFNRYILYVLAAPTTVPNNQVFLITGLPSNLLATHTPQSSATWILSGTTPTVTTRPIFASELTNINDTDTPNVSNIAVFVLDNFAGVYSSGTALYKLVINLLEID